MTDYELLREIVKVLDKKKAFDITALEISEQTIVGDYFIIASGTSNTHVKSLADEVEYEMNLLGVKPLHIEGKATGWILLDYNGVLVHLFTGDQREFYGLERLWKDTKNVDLSDLITED